MAEYRWRGAVCEHRVIGVADVLVVYRWRTPCTSYPLVRRGEWRIERVVYDEDDYYMEGVGGYDFFRVVRPIPVTVLRYRDETWMVDDPMHALGMQLLAEACEGRVLVGGLGLGLVLHFLMRNPKVASITVVELDEELVKLMRPLLEERGVVTDYVVGDAISYVIAHGNRYDTVLLDIWAFSEEEGVEVVRARRWHMELVRQALRAFLPSHVRLYIWGYRDSETNPAVWKKPVYLEALA